MIPTSLLHNTYEEIASVSDEFNSNRYGTQIGSHREIGGTSGKQDGSANPMECSLADCGHTSLSAVSIVG